MKPSKKRITHQDVAQLAGVSTAVVSYVINNGPRPTSPEVRERVLKAIQALDYHPSAFASGLRAQRSLTIGFIVNDFYALSVFTSPYTALILTSLTIQLKMHGYYILVYPVTIGEDLSAVERLLRSGRLDGVVVRLVEEPPATDQVLELIAATQLPCVCIEQAGAARFGFSSITYDDFQGGYMATRYLLMQGHRRIAHICGDRRYGTARDRLAGYQQALKEYGHPYDESLVVGNSWKIEGVPDNLVQLLGLAEPPTAVFAASDELAFAMLGALREQNLRVPEQMAVVGFDDVDLANKTVPALTTIHLPLYEIGQQAADLVLAMLTNEQESVAQAKVLPVALVQRRSA